MKRIFKILAIVVLFCVSLQTKIAQAGNPPSPGTPGTITISRENWVLVAAPNLPEFDPSPPITRYADCTFNRRPHALVTCTDAGTGNYISEAEFEGKYQGSLTKNYISGTGGPFYGYTLQVSELSMDAQAVSYSKNDNVFAKAGYTPLGDPDVSLMFSFTVPSGTTWEVSWPPMKSTISASDTTAGGVARWASTYFNILTAGGSSVLPSGGYYYDTYLNTSMDDVKYIPEGKVTLTGGSYRIFLQTVAEADCTSNKTGLSSQSSSASARLVPSAGTPGIVCNRLN